MKKILPVIICLILVNAMQGYAAEKPLDADRAYNQGVDFYTKLDYNKSSDSFLQSMNTQDKQLEQWSAYNLGSAFFGQGQNAEKNDPSAANQIYQKALDFFKRAIEIDPQDKDAKYNYELTTKKIIEQQQKEKQQQDKKDKPFDDAQGKQDQDQKEQNNQEQKDKQKEQNQQSKKQEEDQQKNQEQAAQQQGAQRQQMTEQEAKMLLENFQQSEDKRKAMELQKAQQQPAPGIKGW